MKTLTLKALLLAATCSAGAAQAYDCVDIRDNNQREACYKNSAADSWRNSSDYQRIQEYNAQQREAERREEERRAEEQRRLEQDPTYQARLRQENAARAAAEAERAEQAEREANRWWYERMKNREADERAAVIQLERLKRIRQRANDRLAAETQRLYAPGAAPLTADDYERLVTLSMPEWDLMRYWADQGLKQFPREFAFRHAVVQTIGCTGKSFAESSQTHAFTCPIPDFPNEALLKTGEASPRLLDRAVACGLRYLKLEAFSPEGSFGPYLERTAVMTPWLADEARLIQSARDCEQGLTPAVRANPRLLQMMADRYKSRLLEKPESWDAYRRWLLVSAAPWNGLDLANPAQVEEGMKRVEEAYHQGSEKEWTYFRD